MFKPSLENSLLWLAAGELQMINLPKSKFDVTSSFFSNDFVRLARIILLSTWENLIYHNVVRLEGNLGEIKLFVSDNIPEVESLGFLEAVICDEIARDPGCSIRQCMIRICIRIMDNDSHVCPEKVLLQKIIVANRIEAWEWKQNDAWFSEVLEVTISPTNASAMRQKLMSLLIDVQKYRDLHPDLAPYICDSFKRN